LSLVYEIGFDVSAWWLTFNIQQILPVSQLEWPWYVVYCFVARAKAASGVYEAEDVRFERLLIFTNWAVNLGKAK
jgi:hypothetical protein